MNFNNLRIGTVRMTVNVYTSSRALHSNQICISVSSLVEQRPSFRESSSQPVIHDRTLAKVDLDCYCKL